MRPLLPAGVGSWWALALRGLVLGIFGLVLTQDFRLYGGLMVLADGLVTTIDAATRDGRSRSLKFQGRIVIVLGSLVLFVWLVRDVLGGESMALSYLGDFFAKHAVAPRLVACWAILTGSLRAVAAVRLRADAASFWFMGASGVSLAAFGLPLLHKFAFGSYPWVLLALLALVSGTALIAVAVRGRRAPHDALRT